MTDYKVINPNFGGGVGWSEAWLHWLHAPHGVELLLSCYYEFLIILHDNISSFF